MARNLRLTSIYESDFHPQVRRRGDSIRDSAVRILQGTANQVTATVSGSENYAVTLRIEEGELYVNCTCPYFEGVGPCKHLWAVLRKADGAGHLLSVKLAGWMPLTDDMGWFVGDPGFEEDEDEYDEEYEDFIEEDSPIPKVLPPPPVPQWRRRLSGVPAPLMPAATAAPQAWPAGREILYVLDTKQTASFGDPIIELLVRDPKPGGGWSAPKQAQIRIDAVMSLPDLADRQILAPLSGGMAEMDYGYYGYTRARRVLLSNRFRLIDPMTFVAFPAMARTGRLYVRSGASPLEPLTWTDEYWRPHFQLVESKKDWSLTACLRQGAGVVSLSGCRAFSSAGWAVVDNQIGRLSNIEAFPLLLEIAGNGPVAIPAADVQTFLAAFLTDPRFPSLEVPESLRYEEETGVPHPGLRLEPIRQGGPAHRMGAVLWFEYGSFRAPEQSPVSSEYDPEARRLRRRNREAEAALAERLRSLGFRMLPQYLRTEERLWEIAPKKLHSAIVALVSDGWKVEAEGVSYRQAGEFQLEVSTGVDWFDLDGSVDFGPVSATLPQLLEALRKGEGSVVLSDGSFGVIPDEWRRRLQLLATSGVNKNGSCRFQRTQAALLDALLATEPAARVDEDFQRIRQRLQRFEGIQPASQPEGFQGQLRHYQKEGLSWLDFLREFGFGGCLADDMGVGKTIQVLALLEARRAGSNGSNGGNGNRKPSLVVAPRSLIFNWMEEARRFTPALRVLDYTGSARSQEQIPEHDLVLTTYGTLRRDVLHLKTMAFDCVILDEAQAIKNSRTDSAKAVRLLKADQRLALTGTPVENHLGELWSIFEFLNPGMLGASSLWQSTKGVVRSPSPETRDVLRRALRPYILRRTKAQVAPELPPKSEQTVFCELDARQRKLYNELRDYYRNSLLDRIRTEGIAKSKIQVLEALLRLRQAACHPALLDKQHTVQESAKFEALMPMLEEIVEGGYKALVFSQFTSLLALLQKQLEKRAWTFEYLDGQTRDRQSCVDRFQTEDGCKLFLISLKAGGLGLNLTAAGYVFLLDPWWNPAVEAQAIDRAHRIGQSQQVSAYRLIARDTVEEKVLALQNTKRELADAIISEDNSVLRGLTREDVALLLS